jgi:hypothetical protein
MMIWSLLLVIATTVVASAGDGSMMDEGIRLSYRLPSTSTLRYDAISDADQVISVMDRTMVSKVRTDLDLLMKVRETVLQRSTIDVSYERGSIRTRLESPDGFMAQDTTVDLFAIKDLRLTMTISPNGSVMGSSIEAAHQRSAETMSMLRSTRIFDRLLVPFPSSDVEPGDTWETDLVDTTLAPQGLGSVVTRGTLRMTFDGTVDTLGVRCWKISLLSTDLEQAGEFSNPSMIMKLGGTGTVRGTSYHDVTTGAVVVSSSVWDTKITMDITGDQKFTVPVVSKLVLSLTQRRTP